MCSLPRLLSRIIYWYALICYRAKVLVTGGVDAGELNLHLHLVLLCFCSTGWLGAPRYAA